MEKHFLVGYTIVCGEYEFSGDTILTLKPKERITTEINKYFLDFYGEGGCCKRSKEEKKDGYYFYNAGEVAVKKIHYRQITNLQRQILRELNVA